MTEPTIVLHGTELSGHAHRVVLLLRMLGLPYRFVVAPPEVRRTPEFLKLNPLGQIPVLEDGPLVQSRAVDVALDGGELKVLVGHDLQLELTGWARPVFAGRLSDDFEKELHETE